MFFFIVDRQLSSDYKDPSTAVLAPVRSCFYVLHQQINKQIRPLVEIRLPSFLSSPRPSRQGRSWRSQSPAPCRLACVGARREGSRSQRRARQRLERRQQRRLQLLIRGHQHLRRQDCRLSSAAASTPHVPHSHTRLAAKGAPRLPMRACAAWPP
eukprot:3067955-Pleurochrysis_carterae.AAC.3